MQLGLTEATLLSIVRVSVHHRTLTAPRRLIDHGVPSARWTGGFRGVHPASREYRSSYSLLCGKLEYMEEGLP
jgi:hypothetical protein